MPRPGRARLDLGDCSSTVLGDGRGAEQRKQPSVRRHRGPRKEKPRPRRHPAGAGACVHAIAQARVVGLTVPDRHALAYAARGVRRTASRCCVSSNREELGALELAPARSQERQRRGACCPARVTRSASTIVAGGRRRRRTRVHAKAQLRADPSPRPDGQRRGALEIGEEEGNRAARGQTPALPGTRYSRPAGSAAAGVPMRSCRRGRTRVCWLPLTRMQCASAGGPCRACRSRSRWRWRRLLVAALGGRRGL